MEIAVRGFLFDEDERILLVKHAADQMRVLPGGHLEKEDQWNVYACLQREIEEETGLDITIIGVENKTTEHNLVSLPLPISIHKVKYEHRTRGKIEKLEYRFFANAYGEYDEIDSDEIYDYVWLTSDQILDLEWNVEIHSATQQILEQNQELLELL